MRGLLVFAAALLLAADLAFDLHNTQAYGGIDLRDKVVAGRLLFTGHSPYTYHWQAGDPLEWLDPRANPSAPLTRYTGTPAQSLAFAAVAPVGYRTIRMAWTLLQYALLLATIALVTFRSRDADRVLLWTAAIVLVPTSIHWHMHVERGQVYVLFAFLVAVALHLLSIGQRAPAVAAGAVLAVLSALKPPYILMLAPLVIARRWPVVLGALAGGVALLALFIVTGTLDDWGDFDAAMRQWAVAPGDRAWMPAEGSIPAEIEGMTTLRAYREFDVDNISARGVWEWGSTDLVTARTCAVLTATGVVGLLATFVNHYRTLDDPGRLLLGFAAATVAMAFLPAPRSTYQLVLWVVPIVTLLRDRRRHPWIATALLVGGALAGLQLYTFIPHSYVFGEAAMLAGLLIALRARRPAAGS